MFLFLLLGFWRFDIVWRAVHDNELARAGQNNTVGIFSAVVVDDPVFAAAGQQIIVRPQGTPGKILITATIYPEYQYGDLLKISGTLEAPQAFDGFDYPDYLAKSGIYATMRQPEIEKIASGKGNVIIAFLFGAKHKLEQGIEQSMPSPQDNLLEAILFGDQAKLSGCSAKESQVAADAGNKCAKLKEQFNIAGLRHLAAVSGEHVTIMAGVLMALLIGVGLWRGQAFWGTLAFIWLFIAMIGLPASAVRAGIMGTLMLLAQKIGRPADAFRIVVMAATLMVLQNPLVLRFDAGFQLSFLAVVGMVFLAKPIEMRLKFFPKTSWLDLRGALSATLSAQALTLPIQIYSFGYVSTYAIFANLLAAPVVPFITIFGFALALIGVISTWLAWLVMFPMWLALSYLLFIAKVFTGFPGSSFQTQAPFWLIAAIYLVVGIFIYHLKQKQRLSFLEPR
jgi:competence protein ComEC